MQHKCQCNHKLELTPWGSNYLADCPNCGQYVVTALDAAIENTDPKIIEDALLKEVQSKVRAQAETVPEKPKPRQAKRR